MTITADELRDEFIDWQGYRLLKTDAQYLLFLLKHQVLEVKKLPLPGDFQFCFSDLLFDHLLLTKHLTNIQYRNQVAYILYKLNQFVKKLNGEWHVGPEISYYGYRSDLAVFRMRNSDQHDVILAVEVGGIDWSKVKECLLNLPELQEIWHFPDSDDYFIWRRGKNAESLSLLERSNKDWLEKLQEEKRKEITKWPVWRWA